MGFGDFPFEFLRDGEDCLRVCVGDVYAEIPYEVEHGIYVVEVRDVVEGERAVS